LLLPTHMTGLASNGAAVSLSAPALPLSGGDLFFRAIS